MKKASEYRQHARECFALANQSNTTEHREQLLEMAETWENLANEREKMIANLQKLDEAVFNAGNTSSLGEAGSA
jgi:hypothetical protein